jgi:hypothetical protein
MMPKMIRRMIGKTKANSKKLCPGEPLFTFMTRRFSENIFPRVFLSLIDALSPSHIQVTDSTNGISTIII